MTARTVNPGDDAKRLLAVVNGAEVAGITHLEPFWMNTRYEQEKFGCALVSVAYSAGRQDTGALPRAMGRRGIRAGRFSAARSWLSSPR